MEGKAWGNSCFSLRSSKGRQPFAVGNEEKGTVLLPYSFSNLPNVPSVGLLIPAPMRSRWACSKVLGPLDSKGNTVLV